MYSANRIGSLWNPNLTEHGSCNTNCKSINYMYLYRTCFLLFLVFWDLGLASVLKRGPGPGNVKNKTRVAVGWPHGPLPDARSPWAPPATAVSRTQPLAIRESLHANAAIALTGGTRSAASRARREAGALSHTRSGDMTPTARRQMRPRGE